MANVDDQNTPGSAKSGSTGTLERGERSDRVGVKALPREDDAQMDPDEYARLLDVYDNSFRNIAEGEVVKGTVLKVTPSEVVVDVGYKSEGIIPLEEWHDEGLDKVVPPAPGSQIQVLLEAVEDESGAIVLSFKKAKRQKEWESVIDKHHEGDVVSGTVTRKIKGEIGRAHV